MCGYLKLNKIFFYYSWVFQEIADTKEDLQVDVCQSIRKREHLRKEDKLP